jgi:hypothetical protein
MKQLRQPSQLVAANISTTAGTELPTLTTAMLDEKSIRNCPRSRSFVCVAFFTGSADEFGIQWSLTDRCVDLHLGAGDVLGHPGIGLVLDLDTVGRSMRVSDDAPTDRVHDVSPSRPLGPT